MMMTATYPCLPDTEIVPSPIQNFRAVKENCFLGLHKDCDSQAPGYPFYFSLSELFKRQAGSSGLNYKASFFASIIRGKVNNSSVTDKNIT